MFQIGQNFCPLAWLCAKEGSQVHPVTHCSSYISRARVFFPGGGGTLRNFG